MDDAYDVLERQYLPCLDEKDCGSSDAMCVYADMHVHCYSCGLHTKVNEKTYEELLIMPTENNQKTNKLPKKPPSEFKKGSFRALPSRKLKKETCTAFNVRSMIKSEENFKKDSEQVQILIPFYSEDNEVVAQKVKYEYKKKGDRDRYVTEGDSKEAVLFGQNFFSSRKCPYITITEGELDALSVYQMNGGFPVVSIRNGADSALKECKANFEYLNSFPHIKICFDADKQGMQASKKVSQLFAGKCSVVHLNEDLNDASGYLTTGKTKDFLRAWHDATEVRIDGIVGASSLEEDVLAEDDAESVELPFETLQKKTFGLRKGEITVIKAPTGVGKSSFVRQILHSTIKNSDWKIGMVSLEDSMRNVLRGLTGIEMEANLQMPDIRQEIPAETVRLSFRSLFKSVKDSEGKVTERLEFCDHYANNDVAYILRKVEQMIKAFDCDIIVLDHITMLAAQASEGEGDRKTLEEAMTKMSILCTANNAHLVVVSQENDDGKTRGTRVIEHQAFNMWRLHRNKMARSEAERNLTEILIEKNRAIGITGPGGYLSFNMETGILEELDQDEVDAILGTDEGFEDE